jgi:hypothetical protein
VIPKDSASKYPSQLAEPENVTKMEPIFYVYVRIGWYEARKSIPQKERGDGTITAVTMCVVWQTKLCIKDYEIKVLCTKSVI